MTTTRAGAQLALIPDDRHMAGATEERPMKRKRLDSADLLDAGFAALGSGAVAGLLRVVLNWRGFMSTGLWWYLVSLALLFVLLRDRTSDEIAIDRVITVVVWSVGGAVVAVLGWMMVFLTAKGMKLFRPGFLTQDLSKVGPLSSGGGAFHSIIGTFEQVGLATVVVVPVSVLTAVYLHEIKGRMSGLIRFIVDAMSGLPSIVAGLLVFTVWVTGHGFSGIAGSAALAVLMLPIVTRTSEEILRTIPDTLREASLALGAPEWRMVVGVVLPTALSGLVTAAILGVARAVGETAPLLLTALGSDSKNFNLLKGPQSALPLFVWKLIRVPNVRQNDRAWTGALILVGLVLILFALARLIASRGQRKLGRSR